MLEIVEQRAGHQGGVGGQIHRCAGNAGHIGQGQVDEAFHQHIQFAAVCRHQRAATFPGGQQHENQRAHDQREPAAFGDFVGVGAEKGNFQHAEGQHAQQQQAAPPPGAGDDHKGGQHGSNQHGAGHRDAIRGGQCAGGAELQHQNHHRHQHHPVHGGDVDLPAFLIGGVQHAHPGQIA